MARHPYLPRVLRERIAGLPRLQRALWALEGALVAALWGFLGLLDPDRAVRSMHAVMSRIGPRLAKSRNIRDNLAIMFPEQTPEERAALEREIWGNWGAHFADYAHLDRIIAEPQRIEIVQRDPDEVSRSGRPAVFVAAHLVNVALTLLAGQRVGRRGTAIFQPDSNPAVHRMIERRRSEIGVDLVPSEGSMRALVRELTSGGSVALVVDHRYDIGEMAPFFGVETPTLTTPARLALRFDCDLIPVRLERVSDGARFRITFHESVKPSDPTRSRNEQALDMTRQVNAIFEQWIRERPGQWITVKRRWPRRKANRLPAESPPSAGVAFLERA
jgi:KDO2-lipid IV(A) lauroyltransferase